MQDDDHPMTQGEFTSDLVDRVIFNPAAFDRISLRGSIGFSERVVETPWVASNLSPGISVLDVGSSLSSLDYFDLLTRCHKLGVDVSLLDIVEPSKVEARYGEERIHELRKLTVYVTDVRLPLTIGKTFDLVTLISTVEHVGYDEIREVSDSGPGVFKRQGTNPASPPVRPPDTEQKVLSNLGAVIKSGGHLLISVPFGQGDEVLLKDSLGLYTYQFEYNNQTIDRLARHRDFRLIQVLKFRYDSGYGWRPMRDDESLKGVTSEMKTFAQACALIKLQKL